MSRSVALSPQFGSTVVFGSGSAGRRRRAKSVHVPLPEGLRVVAVCVPDEIDERDKATRTSTGRPAPHRAPVATRRARAGATRTQPTRRAEFAPGRSAFAGPTARTTAEKTARRADPPRSHDQVAAPVARPALAPRPNVAATRARSIGAPQRGKLRLTRRGQIVVTLLVTGLLLAVFSLGRFSAGAAGNPVAHRTVVVQTGDTLWSIAAAAVPSSDTRVTVEKIRLLNHLDGGGVQVGQQLQLP